MPTTHMPATSPDRVERASHEEERHDGHEARREDNPVDERHGVDERRRDGRLVEELHAPSTTPGIFIQKQLLRHLTFFVDMALNRCL